MGKKYSYITLEQRRKIEALHNVGTSAPEIARILGRHWSTLYVELNRGYTGKLTEDGEREYSAELAQEVFKRSLANRGSKKKGR